MSLRPLLVLVVLAGGLSAASPAHAVSFHGCKSAWKYGQPNPEALSYQRIQVSRVACAEAYDLIEEYASDNQFPRRWTATIERRWTCYYRLVRNRYNYNGNVVCKATGGRRIKFKIFS